MRGLAGCLVVALVACGDDGGEAPPAPTPTATGANETPPAPETPAPETAPAPDLGPTVNLLRTVPAAVAVSSVYQDRSEDVARIADDDLQTAWNSRSGDLAGAWIDVRVPAGVHVTSIDMTAGFTKTTDRRDLFTGNHRVKRVRVLHDGTSLGEHDLDLGSRELQRIPVEGGGGDYRIVVLATEPGERGDWREICVSELRVMGRPGAVATGARVPLFAVGTLPALPEPTVAEAASEDAPAEAAPAAVQARVRHDLEELDEGSVTSIELLGTAGDVHVVKAELEDMSGRVSVLVVVVRPEPSEPVQALEVGRGSFEPGTDDRAEIVSFGEVANDGGIVTAELETTESTAEMATDGECQQRSQSAVTKTGWTLVCAPFDCVAIRRSITVQAPGYERDCRGRERPSREGDPDELELRVELVDEEHVRLTLVRGDVPSRQLGVKAIADLPRGLAVRAM